MPIPNLLVSGNPDYKPSYGLLQATKELYRIFNEANKAFFYNKLRVPVITIQSMGKRKWVTGWCSSIPFWKGTEYGYEINICAEYLNRPVEELVETMLHEMVHYYHSFYDIDDCVNNYHNMQFKKKAEEIGLIVAKQGNRGWAYTRHGKDTLEFAKWLEIDANAFNLYRIEFDKVDGLVNANLVKKKSKTMKCECSKFRISDDIKIFALCKSCGKEFKN